MAPKVTTRKQGEELLLDKARRDSAFRSALIANPKQVIGTELGVSFPDGMDVRVVEETPSLLVLVLPARQAGELEEAQLEQVAGGVRQKQEQAKEGASQGGKLFK